MRTDEQLRRLGRWKQPPDRAVAVGSLVTGAAGRRLLADARALNRVRELVAPLADQVFAAHCGVSGLSGGVLIIGVDDPGLVDPCRRTYLFRLRELLGQESPRDLRITEIRFEYDPELHR